MSTELDDIRERYLKRGADAWSLRLLTAGMCSRGHAIVRRADLHLGHYQIYCRRCLAESCAEERRVRCG